MKYFKDLENKPFFKPSQEKIAEFSLVLIEKSEFDSIVGDLNTPTAVTKQDAKGSIDLSAGEARSRFIAQGSQVVEEYRLASTETKAWRDAGSPSGAVPASITLWATADGLTDEQAAAAIETAESNLDLLLLTIRGIRLSGKAAVENATDNYDTVAQTYIDQLDAITP